MAERFRVTVGASAEHPDVLKVQDAMQQVTDFFDLLSPSADESEEFIWRLVYASTNSPFTAECEATSLRPGVDVTVLARAKKTTLAHEFRCLMEGRPATAWIGTQKLTRATAILKRSTNGVGFTEFSVDPTEPSIVLTPATARVAIEAIEVRPTFLHAFQRHDERGSVEGTLVSIWTYYNLPAIRIRERRTGKYIICTITPDTQSEIDAIVHANSVWQHSRVAVYGKLEYDDAGFVSKIIADRVGIMPPPRQVGVDEIVDPDFTGGLDPVEYLERLREGTLGG